MGALTPVSEIMLSYNEASDYGGAGDFDRPESRARQLKGSRIVADRHLPRVALIATGGTIAALADDPLEILDYGGAGSLAAADFLARCPALGRLARIEPVDLSAVPSFAIHLPQWLELLEMCEELARRHADLAGIVV